MHSNINKAFYWSHKSHQSRIEIPRSSFHSHGWLFQKMTSRSLGAGVLSSHNGGGSHDATIARGGTRRPD